MTEPRQSYSLGPAVVELRMTCGACPSQWEGRLADGQALYVRFRHGRLSMGFGADMDAAVDHSISQPDIWREPWDERYEGDRGVMDLDEMLSLTGLRVVDGLDFGAATQDGFWNAEPARPASTTSASRVWRVYWQTWRSVR